MKIKALVFNLAIVLFSQHAYSAIMIKGGIHGNTGTTGNQYVNIGKSTSEGNGNSAVGVRINGSNSVPPLPSSNSKMQKDINDSICKSEFMKKSSQMCQQNNLDY